MRGRGAIWNSAQGSDWRIVLEVGIRLRGGGWRYAVGMSFERDRRTWEALAEKDPLWAVLSDPAKRGNRWEVEAFFRTGRAFAEELLADLGRLDGGLPRGRALDFGCGVGRVAFGLAPHFREVVGVDVSRRMVELARSYQAGHDNVVFKANERADLEQFGDGSFDFVLSVLVLQHVGRAEIGGYLREFLRVLRPGGRLFFQLPTGELRLGANGSGGGIVRWSRAFWRRARKAVFDAYDRYGRGEAKFVMNGLSERETRSILEAAGGRALRVRENDFAGARYRSLDYYVAKEG